MDPETLFSSEALQSRQRPDGTIMAEDSEISSAIGSFEILTHLPRLIVKDEPQTPKARVSTEGPMEQGPMGHCDFELSRMLGRGGMGSVYAARQVALGREVAVKTLDRDPPTTRVLGLLREARVTGALEHPNIVPVHALGLDSTKRPLMVMKRIDGWTWRQVLEHPNHPVIHESGRPAFDYHLEILQRVCEAVHFAHSRLIIHRDLKPDNIMIGRFGEVYIVDWGLAVAMEEAGIDGVPTTDSIQSIAGTPGYMAPEMTMVGPVDARTDVYLLGAILHRIITGEPPHKAPMIHQSLLIAYAGEPKTYSEAVPIELAGICQKAMAKVPANRFRSADEFRRALVKFLAHRTSQTLMDQAFQNAERLDELVFGNLAENSTWPTTDVQSVHHIFGESRFGFQAALDQWPENTKAQMGIDRILTTIARYELRRGDPVASAAFIAELSTPNEELEAELQSLRDTLKQRSEELEALRKLRQDVDLRVGSMTRSRISGILGLVGCSISLGFWFLESRGLYRAGYKDFFYLGLVVFTLVCGLNWSLRRYLWANAVARRISAAMTLGFVFSNIQLALGWVTGIPFHLGLGFSLLIFVSGTICIPFFIDLDTRFALGALGYAVAGLGCIFQPESKFLFFALGLIIFYGVAVVAWWPRPPSYKF